MYAVFNSVEVDADRMDEATSLLQGQVVPQVKAAPGFVSGTWTRSADGTQGRGCILFDTEANANAAIANAPRPPEGAPVKFVSAEVFEVLAQA